MAYHAYYALVFTIQSRVVTTPLTTTKRFIMNMLEVNKVTNITMQA
jgi:hypothetical protein